MLHKFQVKALQKRVKDADDRLITMLNALSDRRRFCMFKLLLDDAEICVSDLAAIFNVSVSGASQQLRILEMSGLVRKERIGQTICYQPRAEEQIVKQVIRLISNNT